MTFKRVALRVACVSVTLFSILTLFSFYFFNKIIERKPEDLGSPATKFTTLSMPSKQFQAFGVMAVAILPSHSADSIETLDSADSSLTELKPQSWIESQPYETWTVISEDEFRLTGYYLPAKTPTTKTVILAHGYKSQAMEMGEFAKFYSEKLGYNVLLPDARGHGASEGDYIGFGWLDRQDYLLWIQEITHRVGADAQITLHGLSMGGATVMMVSGEDLPEQVKVIVEDSGYTSVQDELSYQLKKMYSIPSFPLIPAVSLLTDIKAGYNFNEASSLKQVEKNTLPMLFIHGTLDDFVPVDMALQLYDASKAEKKLYLAENAGHGMAFYTDQSRYETIVADFIELFMGHSSLEDSF